MSRALDSEGSVTDPLQLSFCMNNISDPPWKKKVENIQRGDQRQLKI